MSPSAAKSPSVGDSVDVSAVGGGGPLTPRTILGRVAGAGEDRLLKILIGVSALFHVGVIGMQGLHFFTRAPIILESEESIDADLLQDDDSGAPTVSALPKAEKAPEAKVPEAMLPQLTKKVAIEESTKPEEVVADEKIAEPKPPEEVKPAEVKKEQPIEVKKQEDTDNKLELKDAQKRLALEKLRKMQKTAKTMEAPEQDPMAKLADAVAKNEKLNTGAMASLAMQGKAKKYVAQLRAAIQSNYSLPEVYNMKGSAFRVVIAIGINDQGSLTEVDIAESSGDAAFDSLTVDAIKASVPLPLPPPDLIGETFHVAFSP